MGHVRQQPQAEARRGRPTLLGRQAECEALEGLLTDALAGQSRVLTLRGEAGIGKSALLGHFLDRLRGWRVAQAVGVESEVELAYSSLHQVCAPMLDQLERLPGPQREALSTVFGLSAGPAPDRFLVGLATLTILAEASEQQPLALVVDDAHWLDHASEQILGFVARRLLAERIVIVCAARTDVGDHILSGLPELSIVGLGDTDARDLLLTNVHGPLDAALFDQVIAECHGNPLALLELPRSMSVGDFTGGPALPPSQSVASKIEQSYVRRLKLLPSETRFLVLTAAAEPLGDPVLFHRAIGTSGIDMTALDPAVDAGLIAVDTRVTFAHPLVRSAAYRTATVDERHRVHRALAEATDAGTDPDRRAWHRARAIEMPDEDVAYELERSAGRAHARGGFAAAAAFLERSAGLSPDPGKRARRALAAAEAKQLAGDPQAAATLLAAAVRGPLNELESAMALRLQGHIALDVRRGLEAAPFFLDAAARLEVIEPKIARETYLDALQAASVGGRFGEETLRLTAEAARNVPVSEGARSADDLLLAGLASRFTDGYAASADALKQALAAFRDQDPHSVTDVRWPGFARRIAPSMFDDETWHVLATRSTQLARERGVLGVLPIALNNLAILRTFEGDLEGAATLLEESDAIADVTGAGRIAFGRLILAGFRGDEKAVSEQIRAGEAMAIARGEGTVLTLSEFARALLCNGLGRYQDALTAAEIGSARDQPPLAEWSLPELVEAAARCGNDELCVDALQRLTQRTQAAGTNLALGLEARSRALLCEGPPAEELYREAIDRLGSCRLVPELARAHLLYGEWLRRENRRVDAREQLRTAHEMFVVIGMEAFADRARGELQASGEKVRRRTDERRDDLTAQERQIARLARDGLSNPEIAARLFLSARTVEWHLHNVFVKLNIKSRRDLENALATLDSAVHP